MVKDIAEGAKKPLIGVMPKFVSGERIPSSVSSCDSLVMAKNYLDSVVAAGGVPVVLPISDDAGVYESLLPRLDGFLLSGGADLDPRLYGGDAENEKLGILTPERERVEYRVLDYAFAHDVPLLGICRGFQLINVYCGGTLYEDLPEWLPAADEDGQPIKHWQDIPYGDTSHKVRVLEGTLLHDIFGKGELMTNSMHHQGIREIAPNLDVMAYGPGGLVEAVRISQLGFGMGVQWHPEYLGAQEDMNLLFERLVAEAKSYSARK